MTDNTNTAVDGREPSVRSKRFLLGQFLMTPGVQQAVTPHELLQALGRHASGDWGDLDHEDRLRNDEAVEYGSRVFSAYHTHVGIKFWIITEADRSVTTALLPSEY